MAFSKTPSIRSNNQRNMEERWHLQPQRTIEKNLLGRGRKKIVPANNLSHAHRGIIDNHRKRIACTLLVPGKRKISKLRTDIH